jgi:hypothetical protein
MRIYHYILLIFLISYGFTSCKSRKKTVQYTKESKEPFWDRNIDFDYVEIKSDAEALLPDGQRQTFNLVIKIKKDSTIWVSARKFGFEGARALITTDSFFVINRLDRSFIGEPIYKIRDFIGFESSLIQLQNILLGMSLFEKERYQTLENDTTTDFKGVKGGLINNLKIDASLLIKNSSLTNFGNTQNAVIQYFEYIKIEKFLLPKNIDIKANSGNQNVSCVLNFTNIVFKKSDTFAFSIPHGYKKL